MGILQAIEGHAASHPEQVAHRWSGGSLTWGDLWRRSGNLAVRLHADPRGSGRPVVIHAHTQSDALVAMLACVRAGVPYVPVDDSIAPGRLTATLAAAGAALVLAVSPLPDGFDLPQGCAALDAAAVADASAPDATPDPAWATAGTGVWYVIFTSGSTGEPKGVQISADNLASFVTWLAGLLPAGGQVFLNQAPWSFDLSVMDTWVSLATGGTLISLDRDQIARPAALLEALRTSGVTTWVSTPSFADLCLALEAFTADLVDVGTFLFCGETLPAAMASALLERFPRAEVVNTYGPTEATVAVTHVVVTPAVLEAHPVLPVGHPKPGCTLTIRDADGGEVPAGQVGEIWIHGDTVSAGYLGRPDLTGVAFAPDRGRPTYRTGDLGRLVDGVLFFEGRADHQVKLHGYRIELGDIEAQLARLDEVDAAVVLPRGEAGALTHLEAVVRLADPQAPRSLTTTLALRRRLGDLLPAYMIPKTFTYVDVFPLTANGKVDRRALEGR